MKCLINFPILLQNPTSNSKTLGATLKSWEQSKTYGATNPPSFSRFDVYCIQTDSQTDVQGKYIQTDRQEKYVYIYKEKPRI